MTKRKATIWAMLLLFERVKLENQKVMWEAVKKLGICSQRTFYRYHKRWVESDAEANVIMKEMFK